MIEYPIEIIQFVEAQYITNQFSYRVSPTTIEFIECYPALVLGQLNLCDYENKTLTLSPAFQQLMYTLVLAGELDPEVLETHSLKELNILLQKEQGAGGLLRKKGKERWEINDNTTLLELKPLLLRNFEDIGFFSTHPAVDEQVVVDHVIIYGARCERMEKRILKTLNYLENQLIITKEICLLGSTRVLLEEEIDFLKHKLMTLPEEDREEWSKALSERPIESVAQQILWKVLAQKNYSENVAVVTSSKVFPDENRPNAQSTTEAWVATESFDDPKSVFAFVEQPYLRFHQQLLTAVITNCGTASRDQMFARLKNTTFHFASGQMGPQTLMSIYLDEIARNMNLMTQTLEYLESL